MVIGIAGVVGVLVSVLAMSEGFRHTLASTGRPDRVILLRAGSDAELSSGVPRDTATLLATLPGVARDVTGRPLASAELVVMVDLPRQGETDPTTSPSAASSRPPSTCGTRSASWRAGRFQRGVREVIVGRKAARQFAGLGVGSRIGFRDSDWTVVGHFASGGDVHESEIWSDAEVDHVGLPARGLPVGHGQLADASAAGLPAFRDSISRDPRFSISVFQEPEYYAKQATVLSNLINVLGYTVAGFMAIGATFGALNCMYSAIASRQVEIATLRAIGFGNLPVVVSVMIEALVLAVVGGGLGGALAYLYCDGFSLSTLNFNTFSQVAFDFRVTPGLLAQGFVWALTIGVAGGSCPPCARPASR